MAVSRRLARAARKSADSASNRIAEAADSPFRRATVATVTPGAASDGAAVVAVELRGSVVTVAGYPDTYTPAVGHRVRCSYDGPELLIDYRIIGVP